MHQFVCKAIGGVITPNSLSKEKLFHKLIKSYEDLGMNFKVTIELTSKNINESQVQLYNAFILRASEHFGNTFAEMASILERLHPINVIGGELKPIERWSSLDLDTFINQANVLLLDASSDFKF